MLMTAKHHSTIEWWMFKNNRFEEKGKKKDVETETPCQDSHPWKDPSRLAALQPVERRLILHTVGCDCGLQENGVINFNRSPENYFSGRGFCSKI